MTGPDVATTGPKTPTGVGVSAHPGGEAGGTVRPGHHPDRSATGAPGAPGAFGTADDPADARLALRADGLLREFNRAGVLTAADVHVAQRLAELADEGDDRVRLAVALAVRGIRHGSVCVDLTLAHQLTPELSWPDPSEWLAAVAASPLTGPGRPVRLELGLLYLDRYWRQEDQVRTDLLDRENHPPPPVTDGDLRPALDRMFPGGGDPRRAAEVAVRRWTTVLGGGPGTGKTTTVARVLAVLADQDRRAPGTLRIALAAPTGKAAARLQEAVNQEAATLSAADRDRLGPLTASTLHRLLGARPGDGSRFRFGRDNRLPHDVIVIDEASMLSLTLTARLLAAVRPDARLLLVGDPDQLASVEAGAVLADLVAGLTARPTTVTRTGPVVVLGRTWRFGGAIADLAAAVRAGQGEAALAVLAGPDKSVRLLAPDAADEEIRSAVVIPAAAIRVAAAAGDASRALAHLAQHRLLCAHRSGPAGVDRWSRRIERWLAETTIAPREGEFYVGRPVLMTANDYALQLFNGDTGVVIRRSDGELRVVFPRPSGMTDLAPSRLTGLLTVHAMTVHRSQGSQFERVTVVLPPVDSELCTRELLYTALTRAQQGVTLVATPEQVLAAVNRPAARASGLRRRLAAPDPATA